MLQDRLVRRSRTDRTRKHDVPEWEKFFQQKVQERRLLYQARVLGWGKEKRYYFAHNPTLKIIADRRLQGVANRFDGVSDTLSLASKI